MTVSGIQKIDNNEPTLRTDFGQYENFTLNTNSYTNPLRVNSDKNGIARMMNQFNRVFPNM